MNSLKTTALMFTGGCLSLCVAASPVQSLQLHFQSPDGQTSADLLFGDHVTFGNSYVGPMGIELYQDPTKDPIDSFLKGESYRVYYHNGYIDPYLISHLLSKKPAKCDPMQCLLPLNYIHSSLYSTPSTAVIGQFNGQWDFHTLMGSSWRTDKSQPYPNYAMGLFRLSLNCASSDLLSCVGSSGKMRLYTTSSQMLLHDGPMKFVGFSNPVPTPTPIPTPVPTPESPTSVPEPSTVFSLLLFGSWGLLKYRRS